MELVQESAPIFVCSKCGYRDETWKRFYDEYLNLYTAKENWEQPKHYVSCILGLFCAEYLKRYKTNYVFVPRNPKPYSSKEVKDIHLMLAAFSNDAMMVRTYILWAFNIGLGSNAQITSLAYLNTPNLIRKFKLWNEKRKTTTRSTQLPKELLEWCTTEAPQLLAKHSLDTMQDLGAVLKYAQAYPDETQEQQLIERATQLKLIKDGQLNVGR